MCGMSAEDFVVSVAFRDALVAAAAGDEWRRSELVSRLHDGGGEEALGMASALCRHSDPSRRALGVDVLGQLGGGPDRRAVDGPLHTEALDVLLALAEVEDDPYVLVCIAVAFGHIGDERCVDPLIRWHAHPNPGVRNGVVSGLLGRAEPAALETLIKLSTDSDADVRDWATFGLARYTDLDFPRLRQALIDRLGDDDTDTAAEAINGLARRGDERALPPLIEALRSQLPVSDPFVLIEALYVLALATGDPRLHPLLVADADEWRADAPDEDLPPDLVAALTRYA
jgi:HEAT repeat protein